VNSKQVMYSTTNLPGRHCKTTLWLFCVHV